MHYPRLLGLSACLALTFSAAEARSLIGADAILQRLASESSAPADADPLSTLKTRVQAFRTEAAALAPEQAAAQWLALYDAFTRLPAESFYRQPYHDRLDVGSLVEALPPPAAWDALGAAIQTRTEKAASPRELGLRLLGAVITGTPAQQQAVVEQLRASVAANKKLESYEREHLLESAEQLAVAISESSGDAARLAAFDRELKKQEAPAGSGHRSSYLSVPDLVRFGGREAAEPLLARALRLDAQLSIWSATGTRALLAELALRDIEHLKRPQWGLVSSTDDVALYEAMNKKFPAKGRIDRERRNAELVYLLGLVAAGRTEEATALVFAPDAHFDRGSLGYGMHGALSQLQRDGRGDAVADFLRDVLTRDPSLPFWDGYIAIAAQQSRSPEVLSLLRTILAKPDLAPEVSADLRNREVHALLAADELEPAVAKLRELLAEDRAALAASPAPTDDTAADAADAGVSTVSVMPSLAELAALGIGMSPEVIESLKQGHASMAETSEDESRERLQARVSRVGTLLALARLLEKPDYAAEGLAAGQTLLPHIGQRDSYQGARLVNDLVDTLLHLDRAADAEQLLLDQLVRLQRTEKESYRPQTQETLIKLAGIYHRAGRHADVLRVFTGSPDLGAADLSELSISNCGTVDASAHLMIVDALLAAARKDEARRILRRIVQNEPGCDAAYERLEKLGGPDYAAFLDEAARLDRFQERPLIWKARLQLSAGQLEEAEKTIRAAIAIDPSDGEQGKGDRMRAYAVLGDILEKRGDADQAALMRGAVAAIRLSEQADDWWSAGLLTRAVRLYEKSLLKFADAYCIQSRLALRYNELGDFAKAEEHYRRAFELMPESFGRVESHCFGCEGAFDGPRAQNIADKVFTSLAQQTPVRAQVYYLLGYLRGSQERPAEAAGFFRKAVALDPDYLNAWSKLQGLADSIVIPAEERQTIALALLRLDPEGKRSSPSLDGLSNLRELWGTLLAIEASLPARDTGPLLEFAASRAKRDAGPKDENSYNPYESMRHNRAPNLREHLSESALINATAQFIEATLNR